MRFASRDSMRARASMSTPRSSSGGSRSATARHLAGDAVHWNVKTSAS